MGIRNRERRKSKHRARGQHRGDRERVAGARPHVRPVHEVSPPELIEMAFAEAVDACDRDDHESVARAVRRLADESGGLRPVVDRVVFGVLQHAVLKGWRRGWQPADVARATERQLGSTHTRLAVDAMAAAMRSYSSATVDRRWDDQLRALDAVVWWDRDEDFIQRWARRAARDRETALGYAVQVLSLLGRLPVIPVLCPLPGSARRETADGAAKVEPRILEKVRALLAKAESTEFPEEAEALTAKAQELMTRHAVDAALLDSGPSPAGGQAVATQRVHVREPYVRAKMQLLAAVAAANDVRVVWYSNLGIANLVGVPADVAATELLFTSLLLQAAQALSAAERAQGRRSASRSFRRSFLLGYGHRIGERLQAARQRATAAAAAEHGVDLLPVLRSREAAVEARMAELFPRVRATRSRASVDAGGWYAGRAAAERADVGPRRSSVR